MASARKDPVLYAYISQTNKKYIDKQALLANRSVSEFVNELLSSQRLKREFKFEQRELKSAARARQALERRKQKLKELR